MKLGIIYTPEEQIKVDNIVRILGHKNSFVLDAVFSNVLKNGVSNIQDKVALMNIGIHVNNAIIKYFIVNYNTNIENSHKREHFPANDFINAILNYFDIVEQPKTFQSELGILWKKINDFAKSNNIVLPKE